MTDIYSIMTKAPVIPVLVIDDIADAIPVAEALVAGGLPCLEVTLRTPCALDAIEAMKTVPGAIVGAGTVLSTKDLEAVMRAGVEFVVSPGLTDSLGRAAKDAGVPFLPGVATSADIMRGLDLGLSHFKFFPAEANGGLPALKAIAAPFGMAKFCPTGGVSLKSAPDWLAHPQVLCVGGSWVAPKGGDRATIERLAAEAAALTPT
ncbi:bifunctional 4-hydroxy-2-oxoglutarate aldolase/2-dehydro-3-deoxy-phosphogluconate aldolase [Croceicoccus bisphenolivorans]|uniref:bifunctional 4-hydroxy-2-oxoglutarate aldolase/2-dehydro-3-deoxy-phosphogluconate aldolase n=1 Tax=Croceicoccus bisphenolivorans TaxID=1783232 RepID=UPI0008350BB3|nr:bifunctional 4-hydroxy-2-oxoglutarate aldolase/2-dehydro-3-deoxy-phosphogluconate aldolase [Croceicoccus bisphenolivorans]